MQILLLVIMTLAGAIAGVFFKRASGSGTLLKMISNRNLYFGGLLYLGAALLNIVLLREVDYSVVLPLTSITYIWTMAFSRFFLKEKISTKKICGVIGIVIGAVFLAK